MRLTKKTVNQDDVSAYHLFYGDELGRPGTDLTFFDWPDIGPHRPGVGTISTISLGVTGPDALAWWVKRFEDLHIVHDGIHTRGEAQSLVLPFRDPEGQRLELVDDGGKLAGTPWRRSPVPAEMAIHRFYFLSIYFREPAGVLFEIATDGPGFAVDEDAATLGERLSLPPFLESERQFIEAHLKPIVPVELTARA